MSVESLGEEWRIRSIRAALGTEEKLSHRFLQARERIQEHMKDIREFLKGSVSFNSGGV